MSSVENLEVTINFILNCFIHVTFLFSFLVLLYYFVVCPLTKSLLRDLIASLIDSIFDANIPSVTISLSNVQQSIGADTVNKALNILKTNIIPSISNTQQSMGVDILNKLLSYLNTNNTPSNGINDILNNSFTNFDLSNLNDSQNNMLQIIIAEYLYNNQYMLNNYIEQNSTINDIVNRNNETVIAYSFIASISLIVITSFLMIMFKLSAPQRVNLSELLIENIGTFIFVGILEYWFFTTYAIKYIPTPASLIANSSIDKIKSLLSKQYLYTKSPETPPLIVTDTSIRL
jgi:hypothetical protein